VSEPLIGRAPAATAPRVAPGGIRDTGLLPWLIARGGGLTMGTGPLVLFSTLGRHRRLFRRWLFFAAGLMPGGRLPRTDSELVILRVAHLTGCDYERNHHLRIGRRAGLSREQIDATTTGPSAALWSNRQRTILTAADVLVRERDLDDTTWAALREQLSERDCIELCLLVGHYVMLAMTIAALRIQPERHIDGRAAQVRAALR
jgi:AhpD family alkylhydroperoxidase